MQGQMVTKITTMPPFKARTQRKKIPLTAVCLSILHAPILCPLTPNILNGKTFTMHFAHPCGAIALPLVPCFVSIVCVAHNGQLPQNSSHTNRVRDGLERWMVFFVIWYLFKRFPIELTHRSFVTQSGNCVAGNGCKAGMVCAKLWFTVTNSHLSQDGQ